MISTIISSFGISDIFSLLIISTIIYVTQYYYRYFNRINPLPGPFPIPILGNAHLSFGLEYNDFVMSMHKKYGDMFELHLGGERSIVLCRTDLIENIFIPSTKTKYPIRLLMTGGLIEYGISDSGIVDNVDPKSWRYNRQFFTQTMMNSNFIRQSIEWSNELCKELEFYWDNLGENRELDLIKWMHRFTYEIIFKISTGVKNNALASYYNTLIPENYNSLSEQEKEKIIESENFIHSIETYTSAISIFMMFNNFIRHYVPFIRGECNKLLKNKEYMFNRIYKIIKERRIEIENTPLNQPLRHDMLTSYVTANTPRDIDVVKHNDSDLSRPMTDKEIFGNIFDAIRGGTDTTANLFCFVVYYLSHYPEVKQKLQQELETVLGKDLTKPITQKDLDELKYCDAVIKEVNRHFPLTFGNARVSNEKDEIGGFIWPKGSQFQIFYSAIMKREDYWTEPEKFDPDRFYKVEESDKYLREKQNIKNTSTLFGGGIRICPGRKLAIIELKCLLSMIYRKYDVELVDMNAPLKYKCSLLVICKELMIKIKPRKL